MPGVRKELLRRSVALVLGVCAAGAGCQGVRPAWALMPSLASLGSPLAARARTARPEGATTQQVTARAAPADQSTEPRITPQSMLGWSALSAQGTGGLAGKNRVAADGTLGLGAYGSVRVAGLTADEARGLMENHFARYVPQPRVTLYVAPPEGAEPSGGRVARTSWQTISPHQPPPPAETEPASDQAPEPRDFPISPASNAIPAPMPSAPTPPAEAAAPPAVLTAPAACSPTPAATLGPVGSAPRELQKAILPPYVIEPPDVLLIDTITGVEAQKVRGQHLVRPDGTISLGIYGSVLVAGLTLDQAKDAIARVIFERIRPRPDDPVPDDPKLKEAYEAAKKTTLRDVLDNLSVDVLAYNSKKVYVITDGGGYGEQIVPLPFTGNDTVLDALGQINGLPAVSSKRHIWVARRSLGGQPQILPVDYIGVTQRADHTTNYQLFPGDRVYVRAEKIITVDSTIAKFLSPIERVLGATLLGSSVVNSIEGRGGFGGNSSGR